MDGTRFDELSRGLARALSRRRLGGLSVGLGLAALLPSISLAAGGPQAEHRGHKGKKHKKHRTTPLVLNQFGCVNVGGACRGDSANCCSGICQGSAPRRGKPDTSVCVAHNQDGCTPATSVCNLGPSPATQCNPANTEALCFVSTGNASFCGNTTGFTAPTSCRPCAKDADCVALGFPPGSACVLLTSGVCAPLCPTTGNRTCFPPGI